MILSILPISRKDVVSRGVEYQSLIAWENRLASNIRQDIVPNWLFCDLNEFDMKSRIQLLLIAISTCILSGCVVTEVGVTNPIPKMSRIAIVPFTNLSSEQVVDGRRISDLYFSELQKIPGFQVLPIGVTEAAIQDHQLEISGPEDVIKLADLLDVDAIVFGAITEYSAYYPPRLGMQVSWYSVEQHTFWPGIPIDPMLRKERNEAFKESRSWFKDENRKARQADVKIKGIKEPKFDKDCPECSPVKLTPSQFENAQVDAVVRSQSPDKDSGARPFPFPKFAFGKKDNTPSSNSSMKPPVELVNGSGPEWEDALRKVMFQKFPEASPFPPEITDDVKDDSVTNSNLKPLLSPLPPEAPSPMVTTEVVPNIPLEREIFEPQPIMSYTRIFDGSDDKLVAVLRDYVELSGDQRSGGWEGYLQRSDDFLRFCMHRMIVEMIQLHGGETNRRSVLMNRKYK